jgi:hypothetical protein
MPHVQILVFKLVGCSFAGSCRALRSSMPVLSVMFCIDAFISMLGMLVFLRVLQPAN